MGFRAGQLGFVLVVYASYLNRFFSPTNSTSFLSSLVGCSHIFLFLLLSFLSMNLFFSVCGIVISFLNLLFCIISLRKADRVYSGEGKTKEREGLLRVVQGVKKMRPFFPINPSCLWKMRGTGGSLHAFNKTTIVERRFYYS
ncbi:hypothetical protein BKA57DRAFT_445307 [Linnemannia elongata]|nr:hypothetical protein BKA57DRAFT_445307 [Linnemannia elongata]